MRPLIGQWRLNPKLPLGKTSVRTSKAAPALTSSLNSAKMPKLLASLLHPPVLYTADLLLSVLTGPSELRIPSCARIRMVVNQLSELPEAYHRRS